MKMSHQLQEWAADRISWVQYPNLRPADEATRQASRTGRQLVPRRAKIPVLMAILLGLSGFVSILVGLAGLSGVVLFFYLLFKAG